MIASSQLIKVGGHDLSNTPIGSNISEAKRKRRMAKYLGVEPKDIIEPTNPGGDIDIIGHFMAVDKKKKAIVLALRGTYTISGIKTDAAAYTRPFCNGLAHAGIADRTDNIWPVVDTKIAELLKANPGFDFVITGHSLGAGTAALLTLKIKHEKLLEKLDASLSNVNIKCFAFASPPVYLADPEHETVMADAMKSTYAFIHENDCVPFMSFDALRRISKIIDEVDRQTNVIEGPLMALGAKCIPVGIKKVVMEDVDLHAIDKSEKLAIPAPHVMWMRQIDEDKEGNPVYDSMFCRPEGVGELKGTNDLQIFLDEKMLANHMNPTYLRGLNSIASGMKGLYGKTYEPCQPPLPTYEGQLYIVAAGKIIWGPDKDIERCKKILNANYGSGASRPQRMIVEVMDGKVVADPHSCAGQNQGGGVGAGFNKYWNDWYSIRAMKTVVRFHIDKKNYTGHLYVVAGGSIVHDSTNVESCKNYLNNNYGRGASNPQRMIVEVMNGQIVQDPHSCAGQDQGGGVNTGFNKYWNNWDSIRQMQAIVKRHIS